MSTRAMRLVFRQIICGMPLRRYHHDRLGVVETLTQESVVYVRPCFGLLKRDQQQQPEVAAFQTQKPKKPKRARRLGGLWKARRSAGGEA
jgi:hypothetical protein